MRFHLCTLLVTSVAVAASAPWHFASSPHQSAYGCYDGSLYSFLYRIGTSGRLSVFLEDGGTCWDGFASCNLAGLYDGHVDLNGILSSLSSRVGLLSDDPRSAIATDSILYLPGCNADFFLGNSSDNFFGSRWVGRNNVDYALQHVASRLPNAPSQVNVIGTSYGTALNAAYIIQAFGQTKAFKVLTDSSVGYLNVSQWTDAFNTWNIALPSWIPGLSSDQIKAHADDLSAYFTSTVAAFYPQVQFGVVTSNGDAVQAEVYELSGGVAQKSAWTGLMRDAVQDEQKSASNIASYIAPGNGHMLNNATSYWTTQSSNVFLYKWINDLLSGSPSLPNTVDCAPTC